MKHYPLKTSIIVAIVCVIFMGVSPLAWAAQIGLAWDANGEPDLAGYRVYYGTASQSYGTPVNVGNVTSYTLTGLTQGQTYYLSVTAYDTSSNESTRSTEVSGAATDPAQSVAITIATSPTSLSIAVDGTSYTAPQTFNWTVGSSHSIGVSSPQGTSTTRRVFSYWSDGGTQNHSITVPSSATTYTANFTTQHALVTSVNPSGAGTVSPSGTNWYNSGTSASLSATAGTGYSFSAWSGSLTHSTNPTSITMDGPKTSTANFIQNQYTLTTNVTRSETGSVSKNPNKSTYVYGEQVSLTATANSGYAFTNWSGDLTGSSNPATLTMNGNKTVTATFSAVAETVSIPSVPTGSSSGTTGVSYTFTTGGASSNLGHSVQYQFDWKGDATDLSDWGSASQSKTWSVSTTYGVRARARCATDTGVISSWSNGLTVIIGQGGVSYTVTTNPSGLRVTVDGTKFTAPKAFSWTPGSNHTISLSSPQNGGEGTRYVFFSWSDGGAQSHSITVPSSSATYTASFTTQYALKTFPDPTEGGKVTPSGTNWYNSGESVTITAESNPGYRFGRWSGDVKSKNNPVTVKIEKPKKAKGSFNITKEATQASGKKTPNRGTGLEKLAEAKKTGASGAGSTTLTLLGKLENPTGREIVSGVKPIYGWALDGEAVSTVELYIDGDYLCDIPYGGVREDIKAAYPDYPEAERSGFALIWNYSVLSPGEHTVLVRVHNTTGETLDLNASVRVVKFHGDLVTTLTPDTNLSQEIAVTADGVTKTYDVNLQWHPERQDFGIKDIIPRD